MADQLTTNPNAPRDWAGDIVPGALLYAYASGTTTPLTVYADAAATIPHPSPIEADGNGVFPQIFYTGAVKIIVTDPDGVALPGFPLDPAPRSVVDTSGANTISFLATPAIPATNVQAAIERVQANYETELGTGVGFLTRGSAPGSLRTRILSGDGTSISIADGNGDAASPVFSSVKASEAEAIAGTDANKSMTPLRVAQAFTTSRILSALAASAVGAVGTYAFLARNLDASSLAPGSVVAGSSLVYSSVIAVTAYTYNTAVDGSGSAPSGTWRLMGEFALSSDATKVSLWLRVA